MLDNEVLRRLEAVGEVIASGTGRPVVAIDLLVGELRSARGDIGRRDFLAGAIPVGCLAVEGVVMLGSHSAKVGLGRHALVVMGRHRDTVLAGVRVHMGLQ